MAAAHGISVALLRPLAELLGRLDLDPEAFLADFGIDAETTPNTYVSGEDVDHRLEAIAARRADRAFGLTLAKTAVVRPLGLFGHMVWLSGTVRDALARAVRFYAMVTRRTTLSLDETPPLAWLRQHAVPGATRGAILTEFAFASLALRAQAATRDQFTLRAVRFKHANAPTSAYAEVFRAPVTFGAVIDEVELDVTQLDLALTTADAFTSAALEAKVAQLTASGHDPFIDRIRRAAAAQLGAPITLAMIARDVGTTARTLRRHLEHEGTSLRGLVDQVRRERADELLATGTTIKEIAFRLGFSEPSAFSRAYKRWTGNAPHAGKRVK